MKLYAIHDKKALTYGPPIPSRSHETALRALREEVNRPDPGNLLYRYPADHSMVYLGDYDVDNGQLTPALGGNQLIAECSTLVDKKEDTNNA